MKALVLTADAELRAVIARFCAARRPAIALLDELPGMLPHVGGITIGKPDMIFLDGRGDEAELLGLLARTTERHPQAAIILMAPVHSPTLLIAAMRLGVREVVAMPLSLSDLDEAIERMVAKLREAARSEGKVLSFISCKGGSGATFLAANLAHALASVAGKKVLLIDLNLQFGDAALLLSDARPPMSLSALCAQPSRLDAELLESSQLKITPDFGILAAASDPDPDDAVQPEQIESLLQLARAQHDFVLLDLGRQINGVTIRALDVSDRICPILQQTLPFVRNGRRLLEMFSSLGYRRDKVLQIVNRYDSAASISIGDMERTLGQRIHQLIPNSFEIASESINQGVPVLTLARSSALAKSLIELVNLLTEKPAPDERGLIRRLFLRNGLTQA